MTDRRRLPGPLQRLRTDLDAAGYPEATYSNERLRRDFYTERFIPLPGPHTSDQDARTAALTCAQARSTSGHLCTVLGWRLLAANPDPRAADRLRAQLSDAVLRLQQKAEGDRLSVPHLGIAEGMQALADMAHGVESLLSSVAAQSGLPPNALDELTAPAAETAPGHPGPAVRGVRNAMTDMMGAIGAGGPLPIEQQKAIVHDLAGCDPLFAAAAQAPTLDEEGGLAELLASLTDTERAVERLESAADDDLRQATLRLTEDQNPKHAQDSCRAAAEFDALTTSLLLHPLGSRLWAFWAHLTPNPLQQRQSVDADQLALGDGAPRRGSSGRYEIPPRR